MSEHHLTRLLSPTVACIQRLMIAQVLGVVVEVVHCAGAGRPRQCLVLMLVLILSASWVSGSYLGVVELMGKTTTMLAPWRWDLSTLTLCVSAFSDRILSLFRQSYHVSYCIGQTRRRLVYTG